MNKNKFLKGVTILILIITTYFFIFVFNSCQNDISKKATMTSIKIVFDNTDDKKDPTNDKNNVMSNATTKAAFWGLPAITFDKWRPNIHIKASTDNGNLTNRTWEVTPDANPDVYSLFEYSQILYYDSNYAQANIDVTQDATVDNTVIMPLAFEQKIYKRSNYEINKYDVSYDTTQNAVVVTLNTANSNYLTLKPGTRIAIFSTQRPNQWGEVNDYTIVDSIPGENSLQKSINKDSIKDNTSDRKSTRTLGYITYKGGTETFKEDLWKDHWFEGIKLEPEKITIYMSHLKDGNTAKKYWDNIDTKSGNGNSIRPFMLFWIVIQQ